MVDASGLVPFPRSETYPPGRDGYRSFVYVGVRGDSYRSSSDGSLSSSSRLSLSAYRRLYRARAFPAAGLYGQVLGDNAAEAEKLFAGEPETALIASILWAFEVRRRVRPGYFLLFRSARGEVQSCS